MKMVDYKLIIFVAVLGNCACGPFFPYMYPEIKPLVGLSSSTRNKNDCRALFLTPFLKNGSIHQAQRYSEVKVSLDLGVKSHAGFFTVDENYNSSMYFWYFPPITANEDAPILLWLQGGPGATSLFGLFTEIGPITISRKGFELRKYNWALEYHLIFVDNPVGTGFSFTNADEGYCSDEDCIARNLYSVITQFHMLFPQLKNNDFYITGESYAGKYIPSLAKYIHEENKKVANKINLKGLAIGNGYCDPVNQMDYGNYLYQIGLLDSEQQELFNNYQEKIRNAINNKDWVQADILLDKLIDGAVTNFSYFNSFTGFDYYYNLLYTQDPTDKSIYERLLSDMVVRKSIHVGSLPFNLPSNVQRHLINDILKSVADVIAELLSHYRILFYNGQLDIIVAYPLTVRFLRNLQFSAAEEYKKANRYVWRVDGDVAGYVKKAGNLTEVLVRNAGHMVPSDQPKWALDMINKFIRHKI